MPKIIHTNPDKKAMDIFTDDQIQTLEKAIQLTDRHVFISKIDYDKVFSAKSLAPALLLILNPIIIAFAACASNTSLSVTLPTAL